MEEKNGYRKSLDTLLSNYAEGREVFTRAKDWTHPVPLKPGVDPVGLPDSWMGLADRAISIIAHEKYGLKTYPNVIEVISSDQMLDAYVKHGMPVGYDHWSFGGRRLAEEEAYLNRKMGLAYEIVINTDPAIAYCMEQNTKTMQMLVIAHASYGHNSFFKNNDLFQQFTNAGEIVGDMARLRDFITESEEKYGIARVERLLDACHALQSHGVDRITRPRPRTAEQEAARRAEIERARDRSYNPLFDREPPSAAFARAANDNPLVSQDGEENILRFVAANAPHLEDWERRIISGICDTAQYFYPQMQTKVMNEGWASFWHYRLMEDLSEEKLIDSGMWQEFYDSHAAVIAQPDFDDKERYSGINPYKLGIEIFNDIKRISLNPTAEDRQWFPQIAGTGDWLKNVTYAMENFRDESFILQYLSPKVMRDLSLFTVRDVAALEYQEVTAIHDDEGYKDLRRALAAQYRLAEHQPRIEVVDYDFKGDRCLTLRHTMHEGRPVEPGDMQAVMRHLHRLWGHPVVVESIDMFGTVNSRITSPPGYQRPKDATAQVFRIPGRGP